MQMNTTTTEKSEYVNTTKNRQIVSDIMTHVNMQLARMATIQKELTELRDVLSMLNLKMYGEEAK